MEFQVYVQLSWCNVCVDNLFLEAFHLDLTANPEVVSNSPSQKLRIIADHGTQPTRSKVSVSEGLKMFTQNIVERPKKAFEHYFKEGI